MHKTHKTSWIRVPGWLWANLGNRRLDGVTMQKTHAWFVLEPKRSSNVISTNSIWEVSERTSDKWQDGNVYPLQASDCKESAPAHHRGSYVLRDSWKPWSYEASPGCCIQRVESWWIVLGFADLLKKLLIAPKRQYGMTQTEMNLCLAPWFQSVALSLWRKLQGMPTAKRLKLLASRFQYLRRYLPAPQIHIICWQ